MLAKYSEFAVGCVGALAPEIVRLYKLRFSPVFNWSWSYIFVSIPFILLGGFVAWILEPANYYAAFYAGVSTPFIVTTIARDSQQEAKNLKKEISEKLVLEQNLQEVKIENNNLNQNLADLQLEITQLKQALRNTKTFMEENNTEIFISSPTEPETKIAVGKDFTEPTIQNNAIKGYEPKKIVLKDFFRAL